MTSPPPAAPHAGTTTGTTTDTTTDTTVDPSEHAALIEALRRAIGAERVRARPIDVAAYASDASFYRLTPRVVVQPSSVAEMQAVMQVSRAHAVPLVIRAAGTSLSGQAITDGILVDISKHWRALAVEDQGRRVRVGPGVIGADVNRALKPYGRRIGPDPASIDSCMVGGIIANNASGMCCGVSESSYHTVSALRAILPDGTILDSGDPDADAVLSREAPALAADIAALQGRVRADPALCARIRAKYRGKNTTGYALNAFLDYDTPAAILARLMIGSEGTLGFISEAVFDTVPEYRYKRAALGLFADIHAAASAVATLSAEPSTAPGATSTAWTPRAIELMDRACLRATEGLPGMPPEAAALPESAAALLIEYQCAEAGERDAMRAASDAALATLPLAVPTQFTEDDAERAALWRIRKGLFPIVGATKESGETCIIEDVAVPPARLADAVLDLQALFRAHGYDRALLFGHAKAGNCHFLITQRFDDPAEISRYRDFIGALVTLITERYDGALKAEHGTGRNMAPFVEAEWGATATAIMRDLKAALDPGRLFNPGVIISDDPDAHIHNLKDLPSVEDEVDRCVECGFCESVCPSRALTLTPRQRIVVRRELARLQESAPGSPAALRAASLARDYQYAAIDTCATDGLCATECPVGIDTGALVKRLRQAQISPGGQRRIAWLAARGRLLEPTLRAMTSAAHLATAVLGEAPVHALTGAAAAISRRRLPRFSAAIPHPPPARLPVTSAADRARAALVYVPSCLSRILGTPPRPGDRDRRALADVLTTLAERAGAPMWIPSDCRGQCCGLPFASKGYHSAHKAACERMIARMWAWSEGGQRPIVIDASSCSESLRAAPAWLAADARDQLAAMRLIDAVELADAWTNPAAGDDAGLGRLRTEPLAERVLLHPSCATRKRGLAETLRQVAERCARDVDVAPSPECCGTAGDRGLLYPELPRAALALEAPPRAIETYDGYYSTNLTCEIGLSQTRGVSYRSFLYLLEAASRQP